MGSEQDHGMEQLGLMLFLDSVTVGGEETTWSDQPEAPPPPIGMTAWLINMSPDPSAVNPTAKGASKHQGKC